MKKIITRENYVFDISANNHSYPMFMKQLSRSYNIIKQQYPEVRDKDITVEFDTDFSIPMKLVFYAFETDEELATRIAIEKTAKENMKKCQIQQLKKLLAENPELKEELLNN